MEEFFKQIWELIANAFQGELAKAGIVTVLVSGLLYKIQPIIQRWWQFIRQRITSSVTYYEREPNYFWFTKAIEPYLNDRHRNNLGTYSSGKHYAWINGRPSIVYISIITLNDRLQYQITIESFFSKKLPNFIEKQIAKFNNNDIWVEMKGAHNIATSFKTEEYSIVTKNAKQLDKLVGNFLQSDIPKIGIILYGPPGNGKSQSVLSMAKKYKKNIAILSINKDTTLGTIFDAVSVSNRILLLEDIDRLALFCEKDDLEKYSISKSDLLNALDGIMCRANIVIATANNYEKIDKAVLRSGRFDVHLNYENPDEEDIKNVYKDYMKKECPPNFVKEHLEKSLADVYNTMKMEKINKIL